MNRRKFARDAAVAVVGAALATGAIRSVSGRKLVNALEICQNTKADMAGQAPYEFFRKAWPQFISQLKEEGMDTRAIKDAFSKPEGTKSGGLRWSFYRT